MPYRHYCSPFCTRYSVHNIFDPTEGHAVETNHTANGHIVRVGRVPLIQISCPGRKFLRDPVQPAGNYRPQPLVYHRITRAVCGYRDDPYEPVVIQPFDDLHSQDIFGMLAQRITNTESPEWVEYVLASAHEREFVPVE